VDGHITVGMRDKTLFVVDADATQHDVIPCAKSVYVQTLSYPQRHGFNL
jgi:hypothetical protein